MKTLVSLVAVALLAGCSSDDMPNSGGSLDQPFQVGYGEQVTIPQEDLTLGFTQVDEDSRCPADLVCIQAGKAKITITAMKEGFPTEVLSLTLGGTSGGNVATYLDYSIRLTKLMPYPLSNHYPVPDEYVATFVVTKT